MGSREAHGWPDQARATAYSVVKDDHRRPPLGSGVEPDPRVKI